MMKKEVIKTMEMNGLMVKKDIKMKNTRKRGIIMWNKRRKGREEY
jgi:hypothetical protein